MHRRAGLGSGRAGLAASEVRLGVDEQARRAAEIEPALVLAGVAPRLLAAEGVSLMETHVATSDAAGLALFESLGFETAEFGTVFRKP